MKTRSGAISFRRAARSVPTKGSFRVLRMTMSAAVRSSSGRSAQPGVSGTKSSSAPLQCCTKITRPDRSRTFAASRLMRSMTPLRSCFGFPLRSPTCISTTINASIGSCAAVSLVVQELQRGLVHAGVAGGDDAAAAMGGLALPVGDDAAGAGDDRDQCGDVVRLEFGLDHEVEMAGRQHAVGIAVTAIARQLYRTLDPAENLAVGGVHQQGTGGKRGRFLQRRAAPH